MLIDCVCYCVILSSFMLLIPDNTLDAVTVVLFNLLSVFADKQALGEVITGTDVRTCS